MYKMSKVVFKDSNKLVDYLNMPSAVASGHRFNVDYIPIDEKLVLSDRAKARRRKIGSNKPTNYNSQMKKLGEILYNKALREGII